MKETFTKGFYVTIDQQHRRAVTDVKFSSSGKERLMIATVSNDLTLKVWIQGGVFEWTVMVLNVCCSVCCGVCCSVCSSL